MRGVPIVHGNGRIIAPAPACGIDSGQGRHARRAAGAARPGTGSRRSGTVRVRPAPTRCMRGVETWRPRRYEPSSSEEVGDPPPCDLSRVRAAIIAAQRAPGSPSGDRWTASALRLRRTPNPIFQESAPDYWKRRKRPMFTGVFSTFAEIESKNPYTRSVGGTRAGGTARPRTPANADPSLPAGRRSARPKMGATGRERGTLPPEGPGCGRPSHPGRLPPPPDYRYRRGPNTSSYRSPGSAIRSKSDCPVTGRALPVRVPGNDAQARAPDPSPEGLSSR